MSTGMPDGITSAQIEPVWRNAEDTAALFRVRVRTVRMWERRGHITSVDGLYDLVQVLDWKENRRDARMDEVRQGVARAAHSCNHDAGRPHTQDQVTTPALSVLPSTLGPVDFGATFVANGTAASFSDEQPDEPPSQVYDELLQAHLHGDLPRGIIRRVGYRFNYLQRLGIDVDQALLERIVALELEDNDRRARMPIVRPTTVYYLRVGTLIKIGQTRDLASRLRTYPPTAVLLATEIGERDELEAERLAQFEATRAHRREWFHPSAELIEHINSLRQQPLTAAELAA